MLAPERWHHERARRMLRWRVRLKYKHPLISRSISPSRTTYRSKQAESELGMLFPLGKVYWTWLNKIRSWMVVCQTHPKWKRQKWCIFANSIGTCMGAPPSRPNGIPYIHRLLGIHEVGLVISPDAIRLCCESLWTLVWLSAVRCCVFSCMSVPSQTCGRYEKRRFRNSCLFCRRKGLAVVVVREKKNMVAFYIFSFFFFPILSFFVRRM